MAQNGPSFTKVPVMFDNMQNCYTSTSDEDQHWVIQMRKSIDPCFLILKIRIYSSLATSSSPAIEQLPPPHFTSNQSVNCTFLRYTYSDDSPFLRAVFSCDYITNNLLFSHNFPNMLEIRKMNQLTIQFPKHTLNFTAVSFCGIEIQECTRFDCGRGFPVPVHSDYQRRLVYAVRPFEEDTGSMEIKDVSGIALPFGDMGDNSTSVLTLPDRKDERALKIVYTCSEGHELIADVIYQMFEGLVCGPHGIWTSPTPSCRPTRAFAPGRSVPKDITCVICPYFTCLPRGLHRRPVLRDLCEHLQLHLGQEEGGEDLHQGQGQPAVGEEGPGSNGTTILLRSGVSPVAERRYDWPQVPAHGSNALVHRHAGQSV